MRETVKKLKKDTKKIGRILTGAILVLCVSNVIGLLLLGTTIRHNYDRLDQKVDDFIVATEPDTLESDLPHERLGKFYLSWYSPKELGKTKPEELRTSTGKIPVAGRTIAVDPKVIPYGSIVYIQDYGYFIAEDCGGAIKGNRIDVFTASHKQALQHGKRVANVYLLKQG